jgi:hypothetical protein
MTASSRRVLQMRLVVEAEDYEDAVRFYQSVGDAVEPSPTAPSHGSR